MTVIRLTTPAAPPPAPALKSPASGAMASTLAPRLEWNVSTGAINYSLQVATTSAFTTLVVNQTGITDLYYDIELGTLEWDTTYYWRVDASNSYGTSDWSDDWYFATAAEALGEAVDNTALAWTTGGDANWFGQTSIYYYDEDAAQSGAITHSQSTWLKTTVTGPGTVGFYWKVSSESGYDFLKFYIDGVNQTQISGSVDWQQKSYSLSSGTHNLEWRYTKNGSVSIGSDCGWVDKVELPTITVTSPDGGETWAGGSTHTIRWTYTGSPGTYAKIELFKGGVLNRTISSSTSVGTGGNGSYN